MSEMADMNALMWKIVTYKRYRPAIGGRPSLAGHDRAPSVCELGDCGEPSLFKVATIEHRAKVCQTHATELAPYGYAVVGETP